MLEYIYEYKFNYEVRDLWFLDFNLSLKYVKFG